MGASTIEAAISGDPDDFARQFQSELEASEANRGLTDVRLQYNVDNPNEVTINLQWEDIETARQNYDSVRQVLESKVATAKVKSYSGLRSNIGP